MSHQDLLETGQRRGFIRFRIYASALKGAVFELLGPTSIQTDKKDFFHAAFQFLAYRLLFLFEWPFFPLHMELICLPCVSEHKSQTNAVAGCSVG